MRRSSFQAILTVTVLFFLAPPIEAHRINMDSTRLPRGKIRIEVYYSDGRSAPGAEILVKRLDGSEVTGGRTDKNGTFEFLAPPGVDLEVEAIHEVAHRATLQIRALEDSEHPQEAGEETESQQVTAPRSGDIPIYKLFTGVGVIVAVSLIAWLILRGRRAS